MSDQQFDSLKELDIVQKTLSIGVTQPHIVKKVLNDYICANMTWDCTFNYFFGKVMMLKYSNDDVMMGFFDTSHVEDKVEVELISDLENELEDEISRLNDLAFICNICLINPKNTVFFPCKHLTACISCCDKFYNCPICRKHINHIDEISLY